MAGARFIQFEVVGKDQKALQGFYGKLFDWSFDTNNPTAYGMTDRAEPGRRERSRHRLHRRVRRRRDPGARQ